MVDPSPSLVDPTLLLKSEVKEVDSSPSLVDPTIPLESEVKVDESMSSPPNPALSSDSVETEVIPLTQSSSCPSLLIKSEKNSTEVFLVSSCCSTQRKFCLFQHSSLEVVRLFPLTGVT